MPFATSSFFLRVVRPGATSSVRAPSSDALVPNSFKFETVLFLEFLENPKPCAGEALGGLDILLGGLALCKYPMKLSRTNPWLSTKLQRVRLRAIESTNCLLTQGH